MRAIDLNADVGESQDDDQVLPLVSSANIACGAHAGDAETMRRTVALALQHGVAIGAHPGYPDRDGFGRRPMQLAPDDLCDLLLTQIETLDVIAQAQGAQLRHVKPHGALYNQAEHDRELADAIVRGIQRYPRPLQMIGRAGSAMESAARAARLSFRPEAFADRRYRADGSLVPRTEPGAVLTDPELVAAQVRALVTRGEVQADDGRWLPISFETLCLHGDTPGAAVLAIRIRAELRVLRVPLSAAVQVDRRSR